MACEQGRLEMVQLLIAAKASLNACGTDGLTPLHKGCMANHVEVVEMLVAAGAVTSATDKVIVLVDPITVTDDCCGGRMVVRLLKWLKCLRRTGREIRMSRRT